MVVVHEHGLEPGGEDGTFAAEVELLRERGHRVATFTAADREFAWIGTAAAAGRALWNAAAARALRALLRYERPDVVHFHDTFPLLSASLYGVARRQRAAVVQTLHDYRLVCPNARLFGADGPCDRCVGLGFGWPGVVRGCYRDSRTATAATAASVTTEAAPSATSASVARCCAVWFLGMKASLVFTDVRGPREPVSVCGAPRAGVMAWVPQAGRLSVGISAVSYAGRLQVGIAADRGLVPDSGALVDAFQAELRELVESAAVPGAVAAG